MSTAGNSQFLKFPFRVDSGGPQTSSRAEHVREQIEQLLYTSPQERVFRPEFGVGIRRLVFEPNGSALWNITRKLLTTSLAQALAGEVDPKTLEVELEHAHEENSLIIRISYRLAAINQDETYLFKVAGQTHG
jgi:hypothetical protein